MKEIVFCECEYDVDHALAQPADGERIVMPLTPSAAARVAQAGIVYKPMEDSYSRRPR